LFAGKEERGLDRKRPLWSLRIGPAALTPAAGEWGARSSEFVDRPGYLRNKRFLDVIIPALNEEAAIAQVVADLPLSQVRRVIVVDNGSTDQTARLAAGAGAEVVLEPRRGYGQACLSGLAALHEPDVIVFLDGDHSDYPEALPEVAGPVIRGEADLVIGSRVLGEREPGALLPQQRLGNALATGLIRVITGVRFTDLGPFRAITYPALQALRMADRDYGWTVEMQIKAARAGLRSLEVPVNYRRRLGTSKVSGTLSGSVRAGYKILLTIARHSRYRG
jgi:glycosyltransferase involved in cell wall biosynthesis